LDNLASLNSDDITRNVPTSLSFSWYWDTKLFYGVEIAGWWDPLVIDLDGSGFVLTASNRTYFDLDSDGMAESVSWVGANTAFLARDLNSNGRIDDATE